MFINHHNGVPSRLQGAQNAPGLLLAVSPVRCADGSFKPYLFPYFGRYLFRASGLKALVLSYLHWFRYIKASASLEVDGA